MHFLRHMAITVDRLAQERGSLYHGGLLKASSAGTSTVDVYDGLNTSGDLIDTFRAAANEHDQHLIDPGIIIRVGLYVDLGSNVSAFTLLYHPVPSEAP